MDVPLAIQLSTIIYPRYNLPQYMYILCFGKIFFELFLDSPLRHWVRNEDICPRFTCSVPFGGSRWENHSNLFVAGTDGRWQNGTLRPQSRRSHLKSLVFINKVIIAFSPLHLFSLYLWTWNFQFEIQNYFAQLKKLEWSKNSHWN